VCLSILVILRELITGYSLDNVQFGSDQLYPTSARIGVLFGCETVAAFSDRGTIKRAPHVKRTLNSAWRVLASEKLATPGF
jgi:hypothetical protein